MPRLPYLVIADDLTGAAELAALAHQAGLRAVVLTEAPRGPLKAEVIVCDSDSRLDPPAVAARKVRRLAQQLAALPNAGLFKKTDSVLRGNVIAEIEACMAALKLERALLVPCNPSLGRIILNGRYQIGSQLLHRTAFRRDPHHPRTTSDVVKLLPGIEGTFDLADALPQWGICVGEASSPADVSLWASRLEDSMLPAGGADFFRMWLAHQRAGRRAKAPKLPTTKSTLMLSGTATPSDPITPLAGPQVRLVGGQLPTPAALMAQAHAHLAATGTVSVYIDGRAGTKRSNSTSINRTFSTLTRRLSKARAFEHALITGGTTAACVLKAMDWHRLEVVHVWGPGVVTLRPTEASGFLVTVKPGSYAWPVSLRQHFSAPLA